MDEFNKYSSFEESIRSSMSGAQVAPPEGLWEQIAQSLDAEVLPQSTATSYKGWWAAAAAMVGVVLLASLLSGEQEVNSYQSEQLLLAFETFEPLPIELKAIDLSEPKMIMAKAELPTPKVEETKTPEPTQRVEKGEVESTKKRSKQTAKDFAHFSEPLMELHNTQWEKKLQLTLMMGGGLSGADGAAATAQSGLNYINTPQGDLPSTMSRPRSPVNASHHAPVSYAVSAAYRFAPRWSVESGLNYSILRSDVTAIYSGETLEQELQFLGMPLRVNYDVIASKHFSLYVGGGAQIERCISSKVGSRDIDEQKWYGSAVGSIGAQYNLNRWLALYAQPEAAYYFTSTNLRTVRSDSPLLYNLRLGLRLTFGR